jgi:hypothetical protein
MAADTFASACFDQRPPSRRIRKRTKRLEQLVDLLGACFDLGDLRFEFWVVSFRRWAARHAPGYAHVCVESFDRSRHEIERLAVAGLAVGLHVRERLAYRAEVAAELCR